MGTETLQDHRYLQSPRLGYCQLSISMAAYRLGMSAQSLHRESTNSLIVVRETEFGIVRPEKSYRLTQVYTLHLLYTLLKSFPDLTQVVKHVVHRKCLYVTPTLGEC